MFGAYDITLGSSGAGPLWSMSQVRGWVGIGAFWLYPIDAALACRF